MRKNLRISESGLALQLILTVLLVLAALAALKGPGFYHRWIEHAPPVVKLVGLPEGIGKEPVQITMQVEDVGAGINEIAVRVRQKRKHQDIVIQKVSGLRDYQLSFELSGEKLQILEGEFELEIRAFDRSFFSNRSEETHVIKADYHDPVIEVVSAQHNAIHGGAQLVLYRVFDDQLVDSGVEVGNRLFYGFPAHGLDRGFEDSRLFVALYAVPRDVDPAAVSVRLFARDIGQNTSKTRFYNKVQPRSWRKLDTNLSEAFLEGVVPTLFELSLERLKTESSGGSGANNSGELSASEKFEVIINELRKIDDLEIKEAVSKSRADRFWDRPFGRQSAVVRYLFGDTLTYKFGGKPIGRQTLSGYELVLNRDARDVFAASSGVVVLSKEIGTYGLVVAVDHGLGLSPVYGNMERSLVEAGARVTQGQRIGIGGGRALTAAGGYYFGVWIQGQPVDAREWWDQDWFDAHVNGKIEETKKVLGIPL